MSEFVHNERKHDELYCAIERTQERIADDWMAALANIRLERVDDV